MLITKGTRMSTFYIIKSVVYFYNIHKCFIFVVIKLTNKNELWKRQKNIQ